MNLQIILTQCQQFIKIIIIIFIYFRYVKSRPTWDWFIVSAPPPSASLTPWFSWSALWQWFRNTVSEPLSLKALVDNIR